MLPVGVLSERSDVGSDLVHEHLSLCGLRHVNHLLYDVVGVLVLHHCVEGTVAGGGVKEGVTGGGGETGCGWQGEGLRRG